MEHMVLFSGFSVDFFGIPVAVSYWTTILLILITADSSVYIGKQMKADGKTHSPRRFIFFAGCISSVATFISLALHEIGHALAMKMMGVKVISAGFSFWGAYVATNISMEQVSPLSEIIICFAGPFVNFLIAGLAAIPVAIYGESIAENTVQYVSYINIRLGKLNLLPIVMLDGGKVLEGLLRFFFNYELSGKIVLFTSAATITYFLLLRRKGSEDHQRLEDKLEAL